MKLWKSLDQHSRIMFIVRAALIAALYAALTLALYPISYGPVQFRVSEALTLLPVFMPEAIPGLFVGCLLANLIGSATIWDIVFGSLATLIAAVLTYATRRNRYIAAAWPVIYSFRVDSSSGVSVPTTRHSATPPSCPSRSSAVKTTDLTLSSTLSFRPYQCMMPRSASSGIRFFTSAARMSPS